MLLTKKPWVVEAVLVPQLGRVDHPFSFPEVPVWLKLLIEDGYILPYLMDDGIWYFKLSIIKDRYDTRVRPGDYIIREQNGTIDVLSPKVAAEQYNLLEGEKQMLTNETPLTTPQPPEETPLGTQFKSADAVAQEQEDALIAEELATDE